MIFFIFQNVPILEKRTIFIQLVFYSNGFKNENKKDTKNYQNVAFVSPMGALLSERKKKSWSIGRGEGYSPRSHLQNKDLGKSDFSTNLIISTAIAGEIERFSTLQT